MKSRIKQGFMARKKNGRIEVTFGRMNIGRIFGEFEFKHVKIEIHIIHAHGDIKLSVGYSHYGVQGQIVSLSPFCHRRSQDYCTARAPKRNECRQ